MRSDSEEMTMWRFRRKDPTKSYARLADLLYTRLIANGKIPNMVNICGEEATTAFRNRWQTMIAAIALAQLAMASERFPKSKTLIRDFGQIVTESSSGNGSFTLEILNAAWDDVQHCSLEGISCCGHRNG